MPIKRTILATVATFCCAFALAVPAKRIWRTVQQPDGTELTVMQVGDERLHYFITEDNVPLVKQGAAYYYANGCGVGMEATSVIAHSANRRSQSEVLLAKAAMKNINQAAMVRRSALYAPRKQQTIAGYTSDRRNITGKHKSIVILAQFPDKKFLAGHDSAFYNAEVNQPGYSNEYGGIGSIHDYFYDQSAGKLDLTFDVVGPVTMKYGYVHYGGNTRSSTDIGFWDFAAEAIQAAHDQYPSLNWKSYDWDGDGEVENLYIVYAGYGEASSTDQNTIWPAQSSFDAYNEYYDTLKYSVNFDGVKINTFACGNEELQGGYTSRLSPVDIPMGIGTMTHEFAHCLGFPDLYDRGGFTTAVDNKYGSNYGMDIWSIMDYGPYGGPNNNGWVPTGFTAYEKWAAGWLDYTELQSNDTISGLASTYNGGKAYAIVNDAKPLSGNSGEYFIFENRTKSRWDAYLPAQGLQVTHVNYVKSIWDKNRVNTTGNDNNRQNLTIVAADNSYIGTNKDGDDTSGDLFPYNGLDSITRSTMPDLMFYNRQSSGKFVYQKPIKNIAWNDADSTISFVFDPQAVSKDTTVTSISNINRKDGSRTVAIYTLDGMPVNKPEGQLRAGIYILRDENGRATKIIKR